MIMPSVTVIYLVNLFTTMSEKVRGVITWLYYRDLPRATEFYEKVMGFKIEKTIHEEAEEQKQRTIPEAAMNGNRRLDQENAELRILLNQLNERIEKPEIVIMVQREAVD